MKQSVYDVAITGGGASGMAAAISIKLDAPDVSVVLLEKNSEPGRKVRATGSGRCNISNIAAPGYEEVKAFFDRIGLVTRAYENGLVYPYSESAADVVELLLTKMKALGVSVITDATVTAIGKAGCDSEEDELFNVKYMHKDAEGTPLDCSIKARRVVLAVGGKAGPNYGTTGDGYALARAFGHTIVTPIPVLTGIECEEWKPGRKPGGITLGGTRAGARVSLYKAGKLCAEETGEVQFTKYGLSGICIFNITRFMRCNRAAGEDLGIFSVTLDLYPDGDIVKYLKGRRCGEFADETLRAALRTILREKLAEYVLAGMPAGITGKKLSALSDEDIETAGKAIHSLSFTPAGIRGWKDAQLTSGGVSLDEIDGESCESKLCGGLYITGELADYDGPCGGYNLTNAWLTGMKAAADIISR